METKMRKYILLPNGRAKMLAERVGASRSTVYSALNYKSETQTSERIRRLAVDEYGGIITRKPVLAYD